MADDSRLTSALVLSMLLHLMLLALFQARLLAPPDMIQAPLLDVDVVNLPPPPPPAPRAKVEPPTAPKEAPPPIAALKESGIVPMPDAGEERASDNARFLSDRDNTVERETVHRGTSFDKAGRAKEEGGEKVKQPSAEAKAEKPEKADKPAKAAITQERSAVAARPQKAPPAALPKLDQLLPKDGDLVVASRDPDKPAAPAQAARPQRNLLTGSQRALSGHPGVAAYLPTVQESDITLLNTKASQFAPFVRRVAARVFQHLEINLRQAASSTSAGNGHEYAEVEAVMSRSGERVSATLRRRQTETQLAAYRLLLSSANPQAFFDRNPPPGAEASDGLIHFILVIDLDVQGAVDEGGRRGTAYAGVAAVGLE